MSDIEAPHRASVLNTLSHACDCLEHAWITHPLGHRQQVDVLCRPRDARLSDLTFAIEVKLPKQVGDADLAPRIKQAADYVGARPENKWPRIVAVFVWLVDVPKHPSEGEQIRMDGMLILAQHFRVGHAYRGRAGITLVFGPSAEIYREQRGWTPQASTLLNARRVFGGTRKSPKEIWPDVGE